MDPRTVLNLNRQAAAKLADVTGKQKTLAMLKRASQSLNERLHQAITTSGSETFGARHLQATLMQVRAVTRDVRAGVRETLLDQGKQAAGVATQNTLRYLDAANQQFAGIAAMPLPLNEARMLERAEAGARSTVLNRLASSGEPHATPEDALSPSPAKLGILDRYGLSTIESFEGVLQQGMLAKQSWGEVRDNLTAESPFLQGAPGFWAERIVRTETMGVYSRTNWESIRQADDELGDMVKILAMTDDDRTGWDSYQVHGQIRRPDEPFEWQGGLYMSPPNRPNDREIVVPHRIAWAIPAYLKWRTDEQVMMRYRMQRKKGSPGPRPEMTTVPLDQFGR
jgi:hypothetical protein